MRCVACGEQFEPTVFISDQMWLILEQSVNGALCEKCTIKVFSYMFGFNDEQPIESRDHV